MMLSTGTASTSDCLIRVRYARKNTIDEKQRMRREVKQRKRLHLAAEKLQEERRRGEKQKTSTLLYKSMARTYWDWWQWELQKRKEAIQELRKGGQQRQPEPRVSLLPAVHEIDPSHVTDLVIEGNSKCIWAGVHFLSFDYKPIGTLKLLLRNVCLIL